MTTNQETSTNDRIEDQKLSDSPLTLEATPSGDRAYFCKLLHQKTHVLTFTFGVDGGDGPYTEYRAVRPLPTLTRVTPTMLVQEFLNFLVKIDPLTGHDSYGAWREGQHDDLVLATAVACWYGERQPGYGVW